MSAPRRIMAGYRLNPRVCATAVLLAVAGLCGPALPAAAEAKGGDVGPILMHRAAPPAPTAARRVIVERRETRQVTQTGPVVLRGRRPENTNTARVNPGTGGESVGSSVIPPAAVLPSDAGFDTSLDRTGLSPPGGILRLRQ